MFVGLVLLLVVHGWRGLFVCISPFLASFQAGDSA